jgi:hypothetical protein
MSQKKANYLKITFNAVGQKQKANIRGKLTKVLDDILYQRWKKEVFQQTVEDVEDMVQQIIDLGNLTGFPDDVEADPTNSVTATQPAPPQLDQVCDDEDLDDGQ